MTKTGEAAPKLASEPDVPPPTAGMVRLYYLDNLRAAAVLAVLLLHTSICYMVAAPQWWYVVDPDVSVVFTVIVLIVIVPVIAVMFLVTPYLGRILAEVWGADLTVVERELTLVGVNPAMDALTDLAAAMKAAAEDEARAAGKALAERLLDNPSAAA